ncbi:hypothetical protein BYT27DRAFT_7314007 [Phlegmacium glaucopus]|nr:hypothetical protein BYT27DRAFT_7314007 [Phlegmacium glaucopus]
MLGTSDGYSTQTGELEHRRCKRFYPRVHKGLYVTGIAREVRHERILQFTVKNQALAITHHARKKQKTMSRKSFAIPFSESERLPASQPNQHHQISDDTRHSHDISRMLGDYYDDPATKDFIPRLKDFALCKILNQEYDFDEVSFSEAERALITFVKNKIYQHKVMRVNYTTYDMRREQDSLNPRTHANVMVLSQENEPDAHPYWYARIIGIYHTLV